MKKLTVILGLVLVMLLVPLSCAPPALESGALAIQPEITDITITGYHSTRDIEGNYDPDRVEATFNWETKKPCYYCFEVRPVDFDYPSNSGGYEKLDVSAPLQEGVKHSWPIVLKSGKIHLYELTIWDKEKNYFTKSDTFWAPVVPKAPPPPAPAPSPAPEPAPSPGEVQTPPPASSPGYPNHGITTTRATPEPGDNITRSSALMIKLTMDDLTEKSDAIAIGKVVDIFPSRKVDGEPMDINTDVVEPWDMITDVVIEVERYLYGQPRSSYIAVMVRGGRVGETVMWVEDAPVFNVGEEVALFLYWMQSDITPPEGFDRAEYFRVTGSMQGKLGYKDGNMVNLRGDSFAVSEIEHKIASIRVDG